MQQGHWRKLKDSHEGEGRYGEKTKGKTWVDREETKKSKAAKKKGEVPPPILVDAKNDFGVFAVPGGTFMFVVHASIVEDFMGAVVNAKGSWTEDKKVKQIMTKAEEAGKFGIFRTEKPVIEM